MFSRSTLKLMARRRAHCRRGYAARAAASSSSNKRIQQNEFTEKAWQAIVAGPELASEVSQQMVETEHLMKALLEEPNGLARRIVSKAGSNPSALLEKTDDFIRKQPRVSGDHGGQVRLLAATRATCYLSCRLNHDTRQETCCWAFTCTSMLL